MADTVCRPFRALTTPSVAKVRSLSARSLAGVVSIAAYSSGEEPELIVTNIFIITLG
ncbi:hypothetical protein ACQE3E_23810 (plasmid) [Methylomonas sp. MED-D]|uniref:hypothetical protein n=1 Tax=Methylomonas sp. MED-D TaxID=3418768 RepID=UPI003D065B55